MSKVNKEIKKYRKEVLKKAVIDGFVYDAKSGNIYANPDSVKRTGYRRVLDKPLGGLHTVKSPVYTYRYLTISVPYGRYDERGVFKTSANQIVRVSRIVWFLNTGEWPTGNVLHKDNNPKNCRFENLAHISPRFMHVYKKMINGLAPEKIHESVSRKTYTTSTGELRYPISEPVFNEKTETFNPRTRTCYSYQEAYDGLYTSRFEKVQWFKKKRLSGVDTSMYENGLDIEGTDLIEPPMSPESQSKEETGALAGMILGAAKFISNFRNH